MTPSRSLSPRRIIAIGRLGIEDPAEISKLALKELGTPIGRKKSLKFTFVHRVQVVVQHVAHVERRGRDLWWLMIS